jgi:DNA-binding response OmpR family regulator
MAVEQAAEMYMTRVLVIDDGADIRELVAFKLRRLGYEVEAAPDGEAGLAAAMQTTPDVVLLDVMMPKMSGLDVLRELRARDETATTPIILLTAKAHEAHIVHGFALGADDHVTKPFSPRELVSRVQALLDRAA